LDPCKHATKSNTEKEHISNIEALSCRLQKLLNMAAKVN